jgi:hypothetical protein
MDAMKKAKSEEVLLRKYVRIINEINNDCFEEDSVGVKCSTGTRGQRSSFPGRTY